MTYLFQIESNHTCLLTILPVLMFPLVRMTRRNKLTLMATFAVFVCLTIVVIHARFSALRFTNFPMNPICTPFPHAWSSKICIRQTFETIFTLLMLGTFCNSCEYIKFIEACHFISSKIIICVLCMIITSCYYKEIAYVDDIQVFYPMIVVGFSPVPKPESFPLHMIP